MESFLTIRPAFIILFTAFILDLLMGDPAYPYHPVRLMGKAIEASERILNKIRLNGYISGFIIVLSVEAVFILGYLGLRYLISTAHRIAPQILDLFILYSSIALKDMLIHVRNILIPLEAENISEARDRLSLIVGRDVKELDTYGISRATIESLSENFVDGFLSPVFWFSTGVLIAPLFNLEPSMAGIISVIFFKVASTIDSMIGYRNEEYLYLGMAGARLDDILNFIPARLSIFVLFCGALILRLSPFRGLRIAIRDRLKHESPNSAHAESFMAGALNISLGGTQVYPYGTKMRPPIGSGTLKVTPSHIRKAMKLVFYSSLISILISLLFLELFY